MEDASRRFENRKRIPAGSCLRRKWRKPGRDIRPTETHKLREYVSDAANAFAISIICIRYIANAFDSLQLQVHLQHCSCLCDDEKDCCPTHICLSWREKVKLRHVMHMKDKGNTLPVDNKSLLDFPPRTP